MSRSPRPDAKPKTRDSRGPKNAPPNPAITGDVRARVRAVLAEKSNRRSISVRSSTHRRVRDYCEGAGLSISGFVEQRIGEFFAALPGAPKSIDEVALKHAGPAPRAPAKLELDVEAFLGGTKAAPNESQSTSGEAARADGRAVVDPCEVPEPVPEPLEPVRRVAVTRTVVDLICEACGEGFERKPRDLKRSARTYCSQRCARRVIASQSFTRGPTKNLPAAAPEPAGARFPLGEDPATQRRRARATAAAPPAIDKPLKPPVAAPRSTHRDVVYDPTRVHIAPATEGRKVEIAARGGGTVLW